MTNIDQMDYRKFIYACHQIADRLPKNTFTHLYGIPKGGLVPATYLSHLTGLPLVSYPETEQSHTIIITDIINSGKTLQKLKSKFFPEDIFAVALYCNKHSIVKPDIWIYEKSSDWVIFPWELQQLKSWKRK